MLLPIRSKNPPESFPIATILLIAINIFVFAVTSSGLVIKEDIVYEYGVSGVNVSPLTLMTSMFLHADLFHLLGNMWMLYLFGFAVEGRLRTLKFTALYLFAGLAADGLHLSVVAQIEPEVPAVGASGAIMGVMGAALYLFPFSKVDFIVGWFLYWGIWTWRMYGVALWYLGWDILGALVASTTSGVAHLAHIGGAIGGILFCGIIRSKRDNRDTSEAKATFDETRDLGLLSVRELASLHASNPEDTTVTLNWMYRSIRDPMGPRSDAMDAFMRLLPRIVEEQPPLSVGFVLAGLEGKPGTIPPKMLGATGFKCEKAGDFALAARLFESVVASPHATPADRESAMYRAAILYETALRQPQRAGHLYRQVIQHFPMSPFADQAKTRLSSLEARFPGLV
jgi:membrane associated rhomboid family serine protease